MHRPVLLKEVIEYLNPKPGDKIIDATIDGGGHAEAILERIEPNGKLLGIEIDLLLLRALELRIKNYELRNNLILANDSYVNLKKIAEENDFTGADGILFDLGMSSWHLDEAGPVRGKTPPQASADVPLAGRTSNGAGRGFSFQRDEPLIMRFAHNQLTINSEQLTAEEIINSFSYDELVKILKEYGEERFAKSIAAGIIKARKEKPIKTTFELVEIIKKSVPFWYRSNRRRLHFATKTFQALRIAVNNELENLGSGLKQGAEILKDGGKIAIISFHSLEDRIVKNFFKTKAKEGIIKIITKKPIVAGLAEITENPRARSAKLRVAEKL